MRTSLDPLDAVSASPWAAPPSPCHNGPRLHSCRPPRSRPFSLIPNTLELHTSFNRGALWGFGRTRPNSVSSSPGLSVIAAIAILYYLFVYVCASTPAHRRRSPIMSRAWAICYDRVPCFLAMSRFRSPSHVGSDRIVLRDLQLPPTIAGRRHRDHVPAGRTEPPKPRPRELCPSSIETRAPSEPSRARLSPLRRRSRG